MHEDEVLSREEIERLFSELPEGKYVWAVWGGDGNKRAYWFCPFLLTGKATNGNAGWQHVPFSGDMDIWHNDRGFFAFKIADHVKKVTHKVEKKAMETVEKMIGEGSLVILGRRNQKHMKVKQLDEMTDEELIAMTTEDMMRYVLANPSLENEADEKARICRWCKRLSLLERQHFDRLGNDLMYCLAMIAQLQTEVRGEILNKEGGQFAKHVIEIVNKTAKGNFVNLDKVIEELALAQLKRGASEKDRLQ